MWDTVDMTVPEWEILGLYSTYYQEKRSCENRFECFYSDYFALISYYFHSYN